MQQYSNSQKRTSIQNISYKNLSSIKEIKDSNIL